MQIGERYSLCDAKRAGIIRTVNYAFQNILYCFIFCFILSVFFLNVYTFIYLPLFSLYFSVCVIFIYFLRSNSISCRYNSFFYFTFFHAFFFFLVSFRRFRKAVCEIDYQLIDVSPFVSPYVSIRLPSDGFS
jgi:hypothetical protein